MFSFSRCWPPQFTHIHIPWFPRPIVRNLLAPSSATTTVLPPLGSVGCILPSIFPEVPRFSSHHSPCARLGPISCGGLGKQWDPSHRFSHVRGLFKSWVMFERCRGFEAYLQQMSIFWHQYTVVYYKIIPMLVSLCFVSIVVWNKRIQYLIFSHIHVQMSVNMFHFQPWNGLFGKSKPGISTISICSSQSNPKYHPLL